MKYYKTNLKVSKSTDVAYLELNGHPGSGTANCVKKTIQLKDVLNYQGPDIFIDFNDDNTIIGIEILY